MSSTLHDFKNIERKLTFVRDAKKPIDKTPVTLAGGLIDSNYGGWGRLAKSTSRALAAPGADSPNCYTLQLLLRL
jgi:hypothetical protein